MQKIHKRQWQRQQVYHLQRHKYYLVLWYGVGSLVEEEVGGVEEGAEGIDLSVGEGVGSWLSSRIFFF